MSENSAAKPRRKKPSKDTTSAPKLTGWKQLLKEDLIPDYSVGSVLETVPVTSTLRLFAGAYPVIKSLDARFPQLDTFEPDQEVTLKASELMLLAGCAGSSLMDVSMWVSIANELDDTLANMLNLIVEVAELDDADLLSSIRELASDLKEGVDDDHKN